MQTLLIFTALSFLPAVMLLMTSFTRIVIVLSLLRQALGLQQTPPNQVIVGMSLFLTFFVMAPTLDRIYEDAYKPYSEQKINFEEAIAKGADPMRLFMTRQTRESDLTLFVKIAKVDKGTSATTGADAGAGAGLRHQRTEDRIPDRLPGLHSVPDDRSDRGQRADVDGHDDGVAGAGGLALQADAVRARRRLEPADRLAGGRASGRPDDACPPCSLSPARAR
jgi:hypothetical protein